MNSTYDNEGREGLIEGSAWAAPDGTIVAQAIELYDGDPVEMELVKKVTFTYFSFLICQNTRGMFISICTVGIGIGMMALRKKSLLLRHTSLTIGYHQPTISINTLRGIGTTYTMTNHVSRPRVPTGF